MFQPQSTLVQAAHSPSTYSNSNPQYQHAPISPHQNIQSPSNKSFQSNTNSYFNSGYEPQNYNQPLVIQAPPPAPPPPPSAYIPPPPPPMNSYPSPSSGSWKNSNSDLKSNSYDRKNEITTNSSSASGNAVPDALLKSMHGSGKKPFTYTPGGLDLSHVKNSLRVKR